jgi:hypothetical protein
MVGYTLHCVGLSLALIIVIKFLYGGGYVQQALVSLSIGNGPLCPEDKSTHTHTHTHILQITIPYDTVQLKFLRLARDFRPVLTKISCKPQQSFLAVKTVK